MGFYCTAKLCTIKNVSCLENLKSFHLKNALKNQQQYNSWKLTSVVFMESYFSQKRFYSYIIICGKHRCFRRVLWFKTAIMDEILILWQLSSVWTVFPRFFLIELPELFQWLVQSSNCKGEGRSRERHAGWEGERFEARSITISFCLSDSLSFFSNSVNFNRPQTPRTWGEA